MAEKNSFVLYHNYKERFKGLTYEQKGKLFDMIFDYEMTHEVPEVDDPIVKICFDVVKVDLDENRAKYEEETKRRKEAGRKGGNAKQCQAVLSSAKQCQANQADNVYEHVHDNDNVHENVNENVTQIMSVKKEKRKRFTPPTQEDIENYAGEKGIVIDAEKFMDYYASNGWKVGKNPMKDWKAAVRNWARRSDMDKPRSGTKRDMSKEEYLAYWGLAPDGRTEL